MSGRRRGCDAGAGVAGMLGEVRVDRQQGGVWVVALAGEQDSYTTLGFRLTLEWLFGAEQRASLRACVVVVDLSGVGFVDGRVIRSLRVAHDLAQRDGVADLVVVVQSTGCFVARVLQMIGLTGGVVRTCTSRAEAVASLNTREDGPSLTHHSAA
jgi:anti-anti-sigma regulatory factor